MAEFLWIFLIFSFLGWLLERGFAALTRAPAQRRRCLLFLPLCPVYGLGMCASALLEGAGLAGWRLLPAATLAVTAVEYGYHWAGERFFGVRFWDYSALPGSLHGRVCVPFSLLWGLLLLPGLRMLPVLRALARRVPPAVSWLFLMVFAADAVCSCYFLLQTHDLSALRRAVYAPARGG